MKHIRILLLEDNDTDLNLFQEVVSTLPGFPHDIIHADKLSRAIDLIRTTTFDILLQGLSDSQGIETFRTLYQSAPTTPIVVLTTMDAEAIGKKAVTEGAQDYLLKSQINGPVLLHSILCALERNHFSACSQSAKGRELAESEMIQLRRLAAGLEAAREAERTRISREIHNDLEQLLTAIKMDLRWAERRLLEPVSPAGMAAVGERIVETQKLMDQTIEWVQKLSIELRPSVLDSLGLADALVDEARRFEKRTKVSVHVELPEAPLPKLHEVLVTALFRIFQELLSNVARHAQATMANVFLLLDGPVLELRVKDNGIGIHYQNVPGSSLGILRIKERAISLGGAIKFESVPNGGTLAVVRIPYQLA